MKMNFITCNPDKRPDRLSTAAKICKKERISLHPFRTTKLFILKNHSQDILYKRPCMIQFFEHLERPGFETTAKSHGCFYFLDLYIVYYYKS